MKLLRMTGGFGNQLFIYAFYIRLNNQYSDIYLDMSEMNSYKLHNGYELNKLFDIEPKTFSYPLFFKKAFSFLFFKKMKEISSNMTSSYDFDNLGDKWVFFHGYFQSEDFFKENENEIRETFQFKIELLNESSRKYSEYINSLGQRAVSVHIRRGDYIKNSKVNKKFGNICNKEYYQKSIDYISSKINNPVFFVFSDDLEWAKENLKADNLNFIDCNSKDDSWQDMYLMTQCKHNIIANSSFSWWGAWLNNNPSKLVLTPSRWSNVGTHLYIIPKAWIRI